jgi:small subunit ribosomal protein S17
MTNAKPTIKRTFSGKVVSASKNKTARVEVVSMKLHPKYGKRYRSTKNYLVHDEKNVAKLGDTVSFQECRPISKNKCWRILLVTKLAEA